MTPLGLRYARGNLLFGEDGSTAALYRLPLTTYPYLGVAEKWALQGRLERFARVVGADFSLWRVCRGYPVERYVSSLADQRDPRGPGREAWEVFLRGHEASLSGLASHGVEVYVAVALAVESSGGLGQRLLDGLDRVQARVGGLARGHTGPLGSADVRRAAVAEQLLFERLRTTVGLRRATTRELAWLLRRGPLRGIGEPVCERYWQPDALVIHTEDDRVAYEPLSTDIWRLVREPMREDPAAPPMLRVEHEDGHSYQAFLYVGALADEPLFPGPVAELLHAPLEAVGFPVDAVVHARWLGNRDALAQVRKRVVDAEQVYRDQLESDHGPEVVAEDNRELAREYEAVMQSGGRPAMLYLSSSLVVGAPLPEECERRVVALREPFGDIELHRPRGLQEASFFEHCPRPDGGRVRDYVQQVTDEQFGAMIPTATTEIGDPDGVYIGWTNTGIARPVRYDVTAAVRDARTTGVVFCGALGSGKTLSALQIAYGAERRGSLVVDVDPRPDHHWENLPELEGRVETIDLSGDPQFQGKLDPLTIAPEELREDLTASYLLDLLRDPPASWEHAIQRAVRDGVRDGGRSSLTVIDRLRTFDGDAARDTADALEVVADFGLGRLGFGDGSSDIAGAASPITTIRTAGLTLPEPGVPRESYTRAERVSVATLGLVATFAVRLVMGDRTRHKVIVLDEAWFLLASAQGRALLNKLIRLARGHNATILILTHRIGDLGDLAELIGTWFVFGQDGTSEARGALEQIGAPATPEHVAAQCATDRAGRCLMRDLQGRIAGMQFDPGPLVDPLGTIPPAPTELAVVA